MSDEILNSSSGDIDWDATYSGAEQAWSGNPNIALLAEAVDLVPGTEGADAIWLAQQSWAVPAFDVSSTALTRAS